MKHLRERKSIEASRALLVWAVLTITLTFGILGCKSEPLPVPPPPPPPAATVNPPTTFVAPTQTIETPVSAPVTTPSEAPPQTPTEVTFIVITNEAKVTFPDKITFSLVANGPVAAKSIKLDYGSDEHTLVPQTNSAVPEFTENKAINVSWAWEMKKTGSIPPGVRVWWQWELTDANGNAVLLDRQTLTYTDTRFQWQTRQTPDMNLYWHDQDEAMINELLAAIESRLARIKLDISIPEERKPRVYVYRSSEELRGAMLHEQEWTGAVAFPSYNIILTAVSADILDWAKGALPHEITHLIVGEAIFGPFGDVPTWLNEGLAKYSEGELPDSRQQQLNKAAQSGTLISIRSLSGSFPADTTQALLAYAESQSVVKYMLETYGWEKMRQLLAVFKDGATNDKALQSVYGFDQNGLEAAWKASIGAR